MIGELAALSTALCWAIAARLFRQAGGGFSALCMNFWKGVVTFVLLGLVCVFFVPAASLPASGYGWLLLSGVIGIGIGDTCFFLALKRIGDSQSVLVTETLAPIFAALLAMVWISEWLNAWQWLGVAVVILAVDMVIKSTRRTSPHITPSAGYLYAAGAAVCQAVGAVISRDILTGYDINATEAACWRLAGGIVMVALMMLWRRERWLPKFNPGKRAWCLLAIATLLGTVFAMYLQMLGFANAKAGIVQTLIATSAIFSLGVAALMGDKIHRSTLMWSLVALVGVAILVVS
ncbi:DMT family transporter [Alteromonas sp. 14N.309.X.WAT.G.H12]|uniref:DMT family transporter n=1 Tax=Alteromonas sp. 14N.309.X.WAT.G.H12 TaxID=3120824 RepID=UPI002FD47C55